MITLLKKQKFHLFLNFKLKQAHHQKKKAMVLTRKTTAARRRKIKKSSSAQSSWKNLPVSYPSTLRRSYLFTKTNQDQRSLIRASRRSLLSISRMSSTSIWFSSFMNNTSRRMEKEMIRIRQRRSLKATSHPTYQRLIWIDHNSLEIY